MGYKVLFITFWYPTSENKVNGIFIQEHAKAISKEGHEIIVLHFDFAYSGKLFSLKKYFIEDEGIAKVYRIELRSKYWKWFYHFLSFIKYLTGKAYKKLVSGGFHPQIIHANVIFPSGIAGAYLARKYKIPAVLSEHWSGFESFCQHPVFGRATRKAIISFQAVMPVSKYLGGIIRKYTRDSQVMVTVPNVVDNEVYTLKKNKDERAHLSFLVVANWQDRKVPAKRPDIIVESLQLFVKQSDRKVTLHIVGDGNGLDKIKAEHVNYDFECIFHGFVEKNEINALLQETDFFLHASNFETFSIVTVEAFLTGTPVIVSDLPALRELVNQENGILVQNEVGVWSEAIMNAVDRDWNSGKIAASVAGKYNYSTVGQTITSVYKQLLTNIP
jgi:glycosyltransferase involved in cell wall biosynthesis